MCLAIPGKIKSFDEDQPFATVEVANVRRRVNVDLVREEGLDLGDWVLIHVGFAMSKISAEQAEEQFRLLRSLGEATEAVEEVKGYAFGDEEPFDEESSEAAPGGDGGVRASPFQTEASQADEWPFGDAEDP